MSQHKIASKLVIRLILLTSLLGAAANADSDQKHLILFGGGTKPPAALARFVEWGGGKRAQILVINWATASPDAAYQAFKTELAPFNYGSIEPAPIAATLAKSHDDVLALLTQIQNATAIFFTGGDQNRIMDVLQDKTLIEALRARYNQGIVFAGTSAGTAVMSLKMISDAPDLTVIDGTQVKTREGLGLLQEGIIVDQHFIKRQRENRLFGLILNSPKYLGLGMNQDSALMISKGRFAEAVSTVTPMVAMVIDGSAHPGDLLIHLIEGGQAYDLLKKEAYEPANSADPAKKL